MDLITQGILGGVCAQLAGGRILKRRSLKFGIVAGVLPDADVFVKTIKGPFAVMIYHRGFTHSLWFAFVAAPIMGYIYSLFQPFYRSKKHLYALVAVFFLALFTHPLLDLFTSYGTQLLAPFNRTRYGLNAVAIVDPLYTVPLLFGMILAQIWISRAVLIASITLLITTGYLFAGLWINESAQRMALANLPFEQSDLTHIFTDATLGQIFYRKAIVQTNKRICIAYTPFGVGKRLDWNCVAKDHSPQISKLQTTWEAKLLTWFSRGQVLVWHNKEGGKNYVFLEDIRYAPDHLPGHGLWGIEAEVMNDGTLGPVVYQQRFKRDEGTMWKTLITNIQTAFGFR
jgi:inner membrane protein